MFMWNKMQVKSGLCRKYVRKVLKYARDKVTKMTKKSKRAPTHMFVYVAQVYPPWQEAVLKFLGENYDEVGLSLWAPYCMT